MLAEDVARRTYKRAQHNRILQAVVNRPRRFNQYKHQHIHAVLKGLGEDWLPETSRPQLRDLADRCRGAGCLNTCNASRPSPQAASLSDQLLLRTALPQQLDALLQSKGGRDVASRKTSGNLNKSLPSVALIGQFPRALR